MVAGVAVLWFWGFLRVWAGGGFFDFVGLV